jgi:NADPH-dependent 2,4-dienoyl-CoA reductase/sulfur reductase-like enzyme
LDKFIDLVVIGGGPAGMAAAISAKENGIENVAIIERDDDLGGILEQCIHNGFGLHYFKQELTGPEYALKFVKKVKENNILTYLSTMVIDISEDKTITVVSKEHGYLKIRTKAIVLAMGSRERTRGALNIPGQRPAGIFTAGTAQKLVNIEGYMPGKKVVILGSGDIGLIMARRMTLEGAKVEAVIEIMPYSGGLTRNIVQCLDDFDIPLYLSHTVTKIHGKERVSGVTYAKVDKNRQIIEGTQKVIKCDTLLLSVGLIPENELSKKCGVKLDLVTNGPIVDENMQTNISGVFACGNVAHIHDLVDYVTQESVLAGKKAAKYVIGKIRIKKKKIMIVAGDNINYVLPQSISKKSKDKINIFFRVSEPMRSAKIIINADGKKIKSIKKKRLAPGEMERVKLTKEILENTKKNITIDGVKKIK